VNPATLPCLGGVVPSVRLWTALAEANSFVTLCQPLRNKSANARASAPGKYQTNAEQVFDALS